MSATPRLRPLDFQPVIYQNQQMWLVRDPLELTDYQLILTPTLAQVLILLDGSRNTYQIQADFESFFGLPIELEVVEDALEQLDRACLLENERYHQRLQAHLNVFRSQRIRPATLAGRGYPDDPKELDRVFAEYGKDDELNGWQPWTGKAIISPHIDYFRGGPVYSKVWRRAAAAIDEADIVLIFGTDHSGRAGGITLTQLPYATPYGILPTEPKLIEALVDVVGPDLLQDELHHRNEHSVELSAVWLHAMRQDGICPVLPILCGSFHHFVADNESPTTDLQLNRFIEALQELTAGRRVLAVASVDLAHVGPNFGDDFIMDERRRQDLSDSDARLMNIIASGDYEAFYQEIAGMEDRNRICGFSSIYLMLRFLDSQNPQAIPLAYEHCPADEENASLVSICGMLLE